MAAPWTAPKDYKTRPVAVLGGGVLGRRIAASWVSGGFNVNVRDPDAKTREACLDYVNTTAASYPAANSRTSPQGSIQVCKDVKAAVESAWLVIEALPEKLQLKIDQFAELDQLAPKDAILASNSSSYKSSEMLDKVSDEAKARILNTHYYMPPKCMVVELMTDGHTDPAIFPFLSARQREAGTKPYVARKESTGLIFNRLWAAIKRESLSILAEGVSVPKELDELWTDLMGRGSFGIGPCATMDGVGLDTVAFIEDHYIAERGLSGENTVDWLRENYISKGKLGNKSDKGGLLPPKPKVLALALGLVNGTDLATAITSGKVVQVSSEGKVEKVLVDGQSMPDGIDVDREAGLMFWTSMGLPGEENGQVFSAKLDGSDRRCIVPKGSVNTPKQLAVESKSKKIYFCDREGMTVSRCNYDGSDLEILIRNGDPKTEGFADPTKWCVGIAVSPKHGKFYWTQKGSSKSGQGRIFCANIETPPSGPRNDIELLFDNLPEPIDLDIDHVTETLYWTDRGELPLGNSVNRAKLDPETGLVAKHDGKADHEIIVQHLNEAIGLKLDTENGHIYFTDLGGSLYRCNMDGSSTEELARSAEYALTGIALV